MDVMDQFWDAPLEDLKSGRVDDGHNVTCLLCGFTREKGIIYPVKDQLCQADKAVELHIRESHGSVFDFLINLDRKWTGLTDHQSRLMQLFAQGLGDEEVRAQMDIGSASTIRNHRFILKEKERQARVFLVLAELLKQKDSRAPRILNIPPQAIPADERWNATEEEQRALELKFFPPALGGRLERYPLKEKQRVAILRVLAGDFEPARHYSEKEVTEILRQRYDDPTLLRRQLIEHGLLEREGGGGEYWLKNS